MMRTYPLPLRNHRPLRPAFTLVEMVIVIGLILLLTALTLTVAVTFTRQGEVRATGNLMTQLDAVLEEWQLSASRQMSFGINGEPCDVDPTESGYPVYEVDQIQAAGFAWPDENEAFEDAHEVTDAMWRIVSRSGVWREFVADIDPQYIEVHDDEDEDEPKAYHFLDAWGGQILAVHPGREYHDGCDDAYDIDPIEGPASDDDGTIRTPYEWRYGVAVNGRVFFVSAGPDGQFGDLSADPDSNAYLQTRDNVYSYEVKQP